MTRFSKTKRFLTSAAVLLCSASAAHAHVGTDHGSHHSVETTAWAILTGVVAIAGYVFVAKRRGVN